MSFNRYMVECEYISGLCFLERICVLIDTWWNVNMINNDAWISEEIVLIDTWWNVNLR